MKMIQEMRWWNALSVVGALSVPGFTLWLTAKRNAYILPVSEKYFRVIGELLIVAGLVFGVSYILLRFYAYARGKLQEADRLKLENSKLKDALSCKDLTGAAGYIPRAKALWGTTTRVDPVVCTYEDDPVFLQIAVDTSITFR